jgi:hypothetical protein
VSRPCPAGISLGSFVYQRGKTTASYRIKGFPSRIVTAGGLATARRAKGKKACRAAGVGEAPLLSACVLDVGVIGDGRFASSAATLKKLLASTGGPWTLLSSVPDRSVLTVATLAADGPNVVAAEVHRATLRIRRAPRAPGPRGSTCSCRGPLPS